MSDYELQLYKVDNKLLEKGEAIFDMLFMNFDFKTINRESGESQLYQSPSILGYKTGGRQTFTKAVSLPFLSTNISRLLVAEQTEVSDSLPKDVQNETVVEKLYKEQLSWCSSFPGTVPFGDDCKSFMSRKLVATINAKNSLDTIFKIMGFYIYAFVIDLCCGSVDENINLVQQLNMCRRIRVQFTDKAFVYSILGLISPRTTMTGSLRKEQKQIELRKCDSIIVTAERRYAMLGSKKIIYVNCTFAMLDLKPDQYIHIGNDIILRVIRKVRKSVECLIVREGVLRPGMRVIFPCNVMMTQISVEELEDMTFAHGCAIGTLLLPSAGCNAYYDSICNAMKLLECTARLFARVSQEEVCSEEYAEWVAQTYDGIVLIVAEDLKPRQVVRFTRQTRSFIQRCYELKKVIILSKFMPSQCTEKEIITVSPKDHKHFFYYPDSFLLRPHEITRIHIATFDGLTDDIQARIEKYAQEDLSARFHDTSFTGSDSVARAVVRASYDMNADVIIICTVSGRMAEKIAHFRPKCRIIAVTKDVSVYKYLQVVHNITLALYKEGHRDREIHSRKNVHILKKLFYGVLYALTFKFVQVNSKVIFGFRSIGNLGYPEKFVSLKINPEVINFVFDNLQ